LGQAEDAAGILEGDGHRLNGLGVERVILQQPVERHVMGSQDAIGWEPSGLPGHRLPLLRPVTALW